MLAWANGVRITVMALRRNMANIASVIGVINGVLNGSPRNLASITACLLVVVSAATTIVGPTTPRGRRPVSIEGLRG